MTYKYLPDEIAYVHISTDETKRNEINYLSYDSRLPMHFHFMQHAFECSNYTHCH